MTTRQKNNHRNYLNRKHRQYNGGIPGVPQIPADCHEALVRHGTLSAEQEAEADAAIEAATWAILARRPAKEDRREPMGVPEFFTGQYGIVRTA